MSTSLFHRRSALVAACLSFSVFLLSTVSDAIANGLTYDASLGTLPQAQGFQVYDDTYIPPYYYTSPTPTVTGGILYQGLTSQPGQQYWYSTAQAGSFDNGFTMEADLQVISSTHSNPDRFGYYLDAGDSSGREFAIGISSTGIAVNTDGTGSDSTGIPLTPFNTTDGFHDYRLVVSGGTGSLYIDNAFIASTPVNNGPSPPDTPNFVFFGDGSESGSSQTELKSFSYNFAPVPEPASLTLLGSALLGLGVVYLRRRGAKA